MFSRAASQAFRRAASNVGGTRKFGAGAPVTLETLHAPEGYKKIGTFVLLTGYLWIMYRLKEDKGALFGMYKPWLHPHEHAEHTHFVEGGDFGDTMPTLTESEEHDDDDDDDDEDEE